MNEESRPHPGGRWLYDLDRTTLNRIVVDLGMPRYTADQVFGWLYQRRNPDMASWTDISQAHRRILAAHFSAVLPPIDREFRDSTGTRKILLRLHDGKGVEAVWIPEAGRSTLCISTQVGCVMGCAFCATGSMGFQRNLSSGEIIAQVLVLLRFRSRPDERINIVLMGMGEPLLNLQATLEALAVITGNPGMGISSRHITVSTVGLLEPLAELERRFPRVKISLSLHAADDDTRRRLMPRAAAFHDISELLQYFRRPRHYAVTFEYVLISGINASVEHARRLAARLQRVPGKINLIPLNPVSGFPFKAPTAREENEFLRILVDAGLSVTIRRSRGRDIGSACGQLAGDATGDAR